VEQVAHHAQEAVTEEVTLGAASVQEGSIARPRAWQTRRQFGTIDTLGKGDGPKDVDGVEEESAEGWLDQPRAADCEEAGMIPGLRFIVAASLAPPSHRIDLPKRTRDVKRRIDERHSRARQLERR
jgi:hypothetical protein